MAWYKTGTVTVTNNSATVTGSGTNFQSGAQVGFGFQGPNGLVYEITAINSSTSLTITPVYGGSTASGQSYAIVPTQGLTAALASDVTDLITDYQTVADNAGAGKFGDGSAASPGIRFVNDQDTGFFKDTPNEIAVSVGGTKVGEFTSTGIDGTVIGGTTPAAITATTLTSTGIITSGVNGGLIKEIGGDTSLVQGAVGLRVNDAASALSPTAASTNNDGNVDLGVSNIRFKDLYLSGQITGAQLSYTNVATLNDDSVYVLDPVNSIGIVMFNGRNDNYDYVHGIVSYRTSANTYATQMGAGDANVIIGEFSGVPAVSNVSNGKFSVVVSDNGNIYFWNRLGSGVSFGITLLGS